MTFNQAKNLHNEDEVIVNETGESVYVLDAYVSENGKHIIIECNDGNTYYEDEIRRDISKFLALILRHKPEVIGISLDEHGWADTKELIAGINKQYPGFDSAVLKRIVIQDDKKRYSFNENMSLIRANQGHSIKVDVELKKVTPPDTLYHGTGVKYIESINEKGLIPKSRLYVHLSKDIDTARTVGLRHGQLFIYDINAKAMVADGYNFYLSENGVWLTETVPVKYLTPHKS